MSKPIYYSHASQSGVSFGATVEGNTLYIASCFVNDGTTLNGKVHKDRRDKFSRSRAREIINGRLNAEISGKEVNFACPLSVTDKFSLASFMSEFRAFFKPKGPDGIPIEAIWDAVSEGMSTAAWLQMVNWSKEAVEKSYLPKPETK